MTNKTFLASSLNREFWNRQPGRVGIYATCITLQDDMLSFDNITGSHSHLLSLY